MMLSAHAPYLSVCSCLLICCYNGVQANHTAESCSIYTGDLHALSNSRASFAVQDFKNPAGIFFRNLAALKAAVQLLQPPADVRVHQAATQGVQPLLVQSRVQAVHGSCTGLQQCWGLPLNGIQVYALAVQTRVKQPYQANAVQDLPGSPQARLRPRLLPAHQLPRLLSQCLSRSAPKGKRLQVNFQASCMLCHGLAMLWLLYVLLRIKVTQQEWRMICVQVKQHCGMRRHCKTCGHACRSCTAGWEDCKTSHTNGPQARSGRCSKEPAHQQQPAAAAAGPT